MQRSASVSAKYIAISVVYYIYSGTQHGYCDTQMIVGISYHGDSLLYTLFRLKQEKKPQQISDLRRQLQETWLGSIAKW